MCQIGHYHMWVTGKNEKKPKWEDTSYTPL